MSKHTPGPWEYNTTKLADWYTRNTHCVNIDGESEIRLYGNEAEANARLIASAPELLEALKEVLRVHIAPDDMSNEALFARQAIAKAEGK